MSYSRDMQPSLARSVARGGALAACLAIGLWMVDCGTVLPRSPSLGFALERAAACWAWAVVLAALLAPVLGVLDWLARLPVAAGRGAGGGSAIDRLRGALLGGGLDGTALLLTTCLDGLLIAAAAHTAAVEVISRMQQLRFMAVALAMLAVAAAALVAAMHLPMQALVARALAGLARRLPKLGRGLARPGRVLAALFALAAVAGGAIVALQWEVAQYLPWRFLRRGALALALGVVAFVSYRRVALPHVRWVVPRVLVAFSIACAGLTLSLDPERTDTGSVARFETLSGRAGGGVLVALFDADGDGYLPLAGGDCAPNDPHIHPAAIEIAGNGRDEDCDGDDTLDGLSIVRGEFAYPLPASVRRPRQIFLITIDALQYHRLFAEGTHKPVTPNLDALARRSVYFTAAFSQGPSTRSAFPSLFTSRWDCQIAYVPGRKRPHGIEPSERMLAETLSEAGYDTLAVLPNVYFFPQVWKGLTDGFREIVEIPNTSRKKSGIRNAHVVTDYAIDALASRDPQAELFAWIHYFDAHAPFRKVTEPGIGPWGDDLQSIYNSEVEFIDQQIGKLLRAIEKRGFAEPMIIVTADHGTSFNDEGGRDPKELTTEMLRVPLIVHARFLRPRKVETLVSTMDIAPTLANLLQIEGELPYEGVSLVPQLTAGKARTDRYLLHLLFSPERVEQGDSPLDQTSIRSEHHHLIHDLRKNRRSLFAWRRDPREEHDLAHDRAHGAQRKVLRETMTALVGELCAPVRAAPGR